MISHLYLEYFEINNPLFGLYMFIWVCNHESCIGNDSFSLIAIKQKIIANVKDIFVLYKCHPYDSTITKL